MKKFSLALLASLSLLFSPVALFAQTDGGTGLAPASTTETAPIVTPTLEPAAVLAPEPAPAPTPRAVQSAPAPAKPTPAVISQPSPTPVQTVSLDDVKGVVDTVSKIAPAPLEPLFAAIGGALAAIIAVLGIQKLLKKRRQKGAKKCPRCQGSGQVKDADVCATCKGTGTTQEDQEISAQCARCEGEGFEPCPECEGEGKKKGVDCSKCATSGTMKDDDEDVDCSLCRGEGEVSVTVKRDVPCPDCK